MQDKLINVSGVIYGSMIKDIYIIKSSDQCFCSAYIVLLRAMRNRKERGKTTYTKDSPIPSFVIFRADGDSIDDETSNNTESSSASFNSSADDSST